MEPFINIHTHVFTVKDAPDFFLKTAIGKGALARKLQQFLLSNPGSWMTATLNWLFRNVFARRKRDVIERYTSFIQAGTASSQRTLYEELFLAHQSYHPIKIVVLTQVLDHLDNSQSYDPKIRTQVYEIAALKRHALYGASLRPFLGIDPRQQVRDLLSDWVKQYVNVDVGFCGLKIYPAYGFFPFDPRLMPVWEWAAEHKIPVMTHCTRGGSWYLGDFNSMVPAIEAAIDFLKRDATNPVHQSIIQRLQNVKADDSICRNNHVWCNIFGHPENYEVILKHYPDLKICLAHLGGSGEILREGSNATGDYPPYFRDNWYSHVKRLMTRYRNVYSDLSYTISDETAIKKVVKEFETGSLKDEHGCMLIDKLMYGTDFYLTKQEEKGEEQMMQDIFYSNFSRDSIERIKHINPSRYLASDVSR